MNYGGWRGARARSGNRRSFLLYALGSIGTFVMAARAVHWLDGPDWLGLLFAGIGLALAAYYLVRALRGPRRAHPARRR
jgi:uncharacterized membrane protein YfcA